MPRHTEHSHNHCKLPTSQAGALVERIVADLKEKGFRRTEALVALLTEMAKHHHPATLAELGNLPSLKKRDQATIYRLIVKLEEAGAVRRLGLAGRVSHYQLLIPGHHHDYMVCRICGTVEEAPIECGLHTVEAKLSAMSGWRDVQHELEFFGICPACTNDSDKK